MKGARTNTISKFISDEIHIHFIDYHLAVLILDSTMEWRYSKRQCYEVQIDEIDIPIALL